MNLDCKGEQLTYQELLDIKVALDDLLLPWRIDLSLHQQIENAALLEHRPSRQAFLLPLKQRNRP
jgi:hypothetical protein